MLNTYRKHNSFRKKLLTTAIISLLFPMRSVISAETMIVSDGTTHFENGITLDNVSNNSIALSVTNPQSYVLNTGLMNISSTGASSTGVFVDSGGNTTMAAGGTLTITGAGSLAVMTSNGSIFVLNDGIVNHSSGDANTISALSGSAVTLTNDTINSSASNGYSAVLNSGSGTKTTITGTTINSNTGSSLGSGITVSDHAELTLTHSNIQQSNGLNGIYLDGNSVFSGSGLSIINNADTSIINHITGLSLNDGSTANITESAAQSNSIVLNITNGGIATGILAGAGTSLDLHNMNVNVQGGTISTALSATAGNTTNIFGGSYLTTSVEGSQAIYVADNAILNASENFSVSTVGNGVDGVLVNGTAHLVDGTVNASGASANGLYVGGLATASNVNIEVTGENSAAAASAGGGNLLLNQGSALIARGNRSHALVNNKNSTLNADNVQADTYGDNSSVLAISSGATSTLNNSQITSHGTDSALISSEGETAGETAASVIINNGQLAGDHSSIIEAEGGNLDVTLNQGTTVSSGNNILVAANNLTTGATPLASQVDLTVNGPSVTGNIIAQQDETTKSLINLNLNEGSILTGSATNGNDINIDATSSWNITDNSNISSIDSNGAVIFSHPSTGYSTLTVDNDLRGTGSYTLNTYLSDSDSPTDKIHVLGNVYDSHTLFINSTGGAGANTLGNGIEVVQVDGTDAAANGTFTLGNRVAANAFEYSLRKGDITTGEGNDWYLSTCTNYTCATDDGSNTDDSGNTDDADSGNTDSGDKGNTDDADSGNTDSGDKGNTDDADSGNTDSGDKGNTDDADSGNTDDNGSMSDETAPWRQEVPGYIAAPVLNIRYAFDSLGTYHQRTGGDVSHNNGAWGRIYGQHNNYDAGRFSYDTDTWFAQLGADLSYDKNEYNTERSAGVLITLGRQSTDAEDSVRRNNPALSVQTGSIHSDIYSVGGYYTIKAEDGGYIDTIGMVSWYRNQYESASDANQHGYGVAMSVEAGKPYVLHDNLKLEPQAQLKYNYLNLGSFNDDISNVSGVSNSSGEARGGLRLFLDNPSVTPYLTLDAMTTIGNEPEVQIGNQKLRAEFSDNWWQTGAGVAAKINQNTSIYSDVRYMKGFNSGMEGYAGDVGIKINF